MHIPPLTVEVRSLDAPQRLDQFLRRRFPEWGRRAVQRLIAGRQVAVNGRTVWLASWQVREGDRLTIAAAPEAKPAAVETFDEAWLVAEAADLIVLDKPAGLLSEPPRHRHAPNLRDLAIQRFGLLTLIHRLDRDTSGLVLLARDKATTRTLAAAFQSHSVMKEYVAVVHAPNRLAARGVIDARLDGHPQRSDMAAVVSRGGQHAITRYEVVASLAARQCVHLWPETGRMHQLRVHLAHLGAPILGDRLYGDASSALRLLLHAHKITLPGTEASPARTFAAPLPPGFGPCSAV